MSRRLSEFAAFLLCVVLLSVPSASAQSQVAGGEIEGTVRDESGGVLPGATVTVLNQATGISRTTQTDETGRFRAPLLPVGDYEVTATLDGFATARQTGLELTIGQTLSVDI